MQKKYDANMQKKCDSNMQKCDPNMQKDMIQICKKNL